ncbi:28S ribosomal protein S33, mitochondrial isoform X1 [Bufo bufo]|uniref:28S ribosomal protein S33, mitochondrial isoform X1 n=2 Tax=Bufo bufo TaxID=8384 RepID=UPI001ABEA168|nr:28S ribosomal protein S33, mitochondrial isoform X1 [Bufo bufo]
MRTAENPVRKALPGQATCEAVERSPGHGCFAMSSLSSYAIRMSRLSARIFGEVVRPTNTHSMKVVKLFSEQPLAKRKEVYDWYPAHDVYAPLMRNLRFLGLYRDEHEDFKEEMKRLRRLRGKGTPKKGEGKRAKKK